MHIIAAIHNCFGILQIMKHHTKNTTHHQNSASITKFCQQDFVLKSVEIEGENCRQMVLPKPRNPHAIIYFTIFNCDCILWIACRFSGLNGRLRVPNQLQFPRNSYNPRTIQCNAGLQPPDTILYNSMQSDTIEVNWRRIARFMRYQCNAGNQTVFEASTRVLSWKSKTHLLRSRNPSQSKGVILQSVPLYHNYKKG